MLSRSSTFGLLFLAVLAAGQEEAASSTTAVPESTTIADPGSSTTAAPASSTTESKPEAVPELILEAVPCQECPTISLRHYEARDCEPVFDDAISECCPASFTCQTESERGIASNVCIYNNATFAIGESVPVANPCEAGCFCQEGFPEGQPAKVECAQVECPSLFNPLTPGCRNLYNIENCCEVNQTCTDVIPDASVDEEGAAPAAATTRSADCEAEGKTYQVGDKIYFDAEPCRYCVCTHNFTDAYGVNCTDINCGMEYRDREELNDGCTPIYFSGSCCNIDWICPNSTRVKPEADQVATGDETPATHCSLGDIVAPRGAQLPTDNCNLNCACSTPPAFTCVQYSSCSDAEAALKTGTLP